MKRLTEQEVRTIQLTILDLVTEYCDEHGLKYWLDGGTLLGAVRHDGFIPWDDDIDIAMNRRDYEFFLNNFNGSFEGYKAYSIENNRRFYFPHIKVMDMNTVLYEPDEKGRKLAVNIDVWAYDNAPDSKAAALGMYDRRDKIRAWEKRRLPMTAPGGGFIRRSFVYFARTVMKIIPAWYFTDKIVKNAMIYDDKETGYVGSFLSWAHPICSKTAFNLFIDHLFEGKMYKIPVGYDELLTSCYGNYMELPPPEKRVTHHSYVAYRIDEKN